MTLWIIIRKWIKKYVYLYLFSGTLPYRGEMRLCVIYPIPLSMDRSIYPTREPIVRSKCSSIISIFAKTN